jgi:hypothetical protein
MTVSELMFTKLILCQQLLVNNTTTEIHENPRNSLVTDSK